MRASTINEDGLEEEPSNISSESTSGKNAFLECKSNHLSVFGRKPSHVFFRLLYKFRFRWFALIPVFDSGQVKQILKSGKRRKIVE
jgi:hypothetical protein